MTTDDIVDAHRATDHLKPFLPRFNGAGLIGVANGFGVLCVFGLVEAIGLTWPLAAIIALVAGYAMAYQHAEAMWRPHDEQFDLFLAERAKRDA